MTYQSPKKTLYNCLLRCIVCDRLLSITHGIEKLPGVKVNHADCPLHPNKGVHAEWEPIEEPGGSR